MEKSGRMNEIKKTGGIKVATLLLGKQMVAILSNLFFICLFYTIEF
jgi:hypothetical protein